MFNEANTDEDVAFLVKGVKESAKKVEDALSGHWSELMRMAQKHSGSDEKAVALTSFVMMKLISTMHEANLQWLKQHEEFNARCTVTLIQMIGSVRNSGLTMQMTSLSEAEGQGTILLADDDETPPPGSKLN